MININVNTKTYGILKKLAVIFPVLALALGAFRFFVLKNFVDTQNGLYTNAAVGNTYGILVFVLLIACFFLCKLSAAKKAADVIPNSAKGVKFFGAICGFLMAVVLVLNIVDMATGKRAFGILLGAETVVCVPAMLYFGGVLAGKFTFDNRVTAANLLPVFPGLFIGLRTISIFMNTEQQINASERSYTLLALVFIMMFFITEAEFFVPFFLEETLSKKSPVKTRSARYFAFAVTTFCLVLAICLPTLAAGFASASLSETVYTFVNIAFGAYAMVRAAISF